jgi:uncharacterized PurR-regulated membrane protein YhhQ (DUF165 family)
MKKISTITLFIGYLLTIPLANWFINNIGSTPFPGSPHLISVGFGYQAPSGVLLIGLALFSRDLLQERAGKKPVLIAIGLGLLLSVLVNPAIAFASGAAFLASELADFGIYTQVRKYSKWLGMLLSGVVGSIIDSFLFLWLAFNSIAFWEGQIIGKVGMTIICVGIWKGFRAVPKRLSTV